MLKQAFIPCSPFVVTRWSSRKHARDALRIYCGVLILLLSFLLDCKSAPRGTRAVPLFSPLLSAFSRPCVRVCCVYGACAFSSGSALKCSFTCYHSRNVRATVSQQVVRLVISAPVLEVCCSPIQLEVQRGNT